MLGNIHLLHVPSSAQLAYLQTKTLYPTYFHPILSKLHTIVIYGPA